MPFLDGGLMVGPDAMVDLYWDYDDNEVVEVKYLPDGEYLIDRIPYEDFSPEELYGIRDASPIWTAIARSGSPVCPECGMSTREFNNGYCPNCHIRA